MLHITIFRWSIRVGIFEIQITSGNHDLLLHRVKSAHGPASWSMQQVVVKPPEIYLIFGVVEAPQRLSIPQSYCFNAHVRFPEFHAALPRLLACSPRSWNWPTCPRALILEKVLGCGHTYPSQARRGGARVAYPIKQETARPCAPGIHLRSLIDYHHLAQARIHQPSWRRYRTPG